MAEHLDVIDELERRLIDSCYRSSRRSWQLALRGRRTWVPAGGLVPAAAAVVAVVVALLPGGEVSPPPALAALKSAARASARMPSTALAAGKEWYARIVMTAIFPASTPSTPASGLSTSVLRSRSVREVWMMRDGATTIRTATRTTIGGRPESTNSPTTQSTPGHGILSSPLLPVPLVSYRQLRSLPTSAAGLLSLVGRIQAKLRSVAVPKSQAATGPARPATTVRSTTPPRSTSGVTTVRNRGTVTYESTAMGTVVGRCCGSTPIAHSAVGDLNIIAWLLAMPVSAPVRAALYRTAASLPGVRYDGTVRDALGRRGVEISVGSGDDQMRMIFNPRIGALLASSSGFGASALAKGFGPLVETLAVAKVIKADGRH